MSVKFEVGILAGLSIHIMGQPAASLVADSSPVTRDMSRVPAFQHIGRGSSRELLRELARNPAVPRVWIG